MVVNFVEVQLGLGLGLGPGGRELRGSAPPAPHSPNRPTRPPPLPWGRAGAVAGLDPEQLLDRLRLALHSPRHLLEPLRCGLLAPVPTTTSDKAALPPQRCLCGPLFPPRPSLAQSALRKGPAHRSWLIQARHGAHWPRACARPVLHGTSPTPFLLALSAVRSDSAVPSTQEEGGQVRSSESE